MACSSYSACLSRSTQILVLLHLWTPGHVLRQDSIRRGKAQESTGEVCSFQEVTTTHQYKVSFTFRVSSCDECNPANMKHFFSEEGQLLKELVTVRFAIPAHKRQGQCHCLSNKYHFISYNEDDKTKCLPSKCWHLYSGAMYRKAHCGEDGRVDMLTKGAPHFLSHPTHYSTKCSAEEPAEGLAAYRNALPRLKGKLALEELKGSPKKQECLKEYLVQEKIMNDPGDEPIVFNSKGNDVQEEIVDLPKISEDKELQQCDLALTNLQCEDIDGNVPSDSQACSAAGCCWQAGGINEKQRGFQCFMGNGLVQKLQEQRMNGQVRCPKKSEIPRNLREDCRAFVEGQYSNDPNEETRHSSCVQEGCCWDKLEEGSQDPWCFYPQFLWG